MSSDSQNNGERVSVPDLSREELEAEVYDYRTNIESRIERLETSVRLLHEVIKDDAGLDLTESEFESEVDTDTDSQQDSSSNTPVSVGADGLSAHERAAMNRLDALVDRLAQQNHLDPMKQRELSRIVDDVLENGAIFSGPGIAHCIRTSSSNVSRKETVRGHVKQFVRSDLFEQSGPREYRFTEYDRVMRAYHGNVGSDSGGDST